MKKILFTENQIRRYPLYLDYLNSKDFKDQTYISNSEFSKILNINTEVVKKDLALISQNKGKPKVGRKISELKKDLEDFMNFKFSNNAILIGAGQLGKALLNFNDFKNFGLNIIAAFDINPLLYEIDINGINVYPLDKLQQVIKEKNVTVVILTVPKQAAQEIVNLLNKTKIEAIWNFSLFSLNVKKEIIVVNASIMSSYMLLKNNLYIKKMERKK